MKRLQGLYFNFMVRSWKSMQLTPHIAIRDPKTDISRQEWFGPCFIFNSFSFPPTATQPCALYSTLMQSNRSSCLCPFSQLRCPAFARQHKRISLVTMTILKKKITVHNQTSSIN